MMVKAWRIGGACGGRVGASMPRIRTSLETVKVSSLGNFRSPIHPRVACEKHVAGDEPDSVETVRACRNRR